MPINPEKSTADFLVLQYRELDFLINRNQFMGSSTLNEMRASGSEIVYFDKCTDYKDKNLILCDFDQFLMDKYICTNPSHLKLCLIVDISSTDNRFFNYLKKTIEANDAYDEFIGLIVSSQVEMRPLKLKEFNINPPGLDERMKSFGLLGCRFNEAERIQYFIDIRTNLGNMLFKEDL